MNSRPTVYEGEDLPQEEPDTLETPGESTTSRGPTGPHAEDKGQQRPVSDPVEDALAFALTEASKAQRWEAVAQLAGELQARRTARAGVVSLDAKRKRQGG